MTEQERQFADLTLRWTRELSAVAADYRDRIAAIETRRLDALAALRAGAAVTHGTLALKLFDQAVAGV